MVCTAKRIHDEVRLYGARRNEQLHFQSFIISNTWFYISLNLVPKVSLLCLPWSLEETTKGGRAERPWERGCVSLYFGKRGWENQSVMKKSMLRLTLTPSGEEYFELNKDEPRAVPSIKNHAGGLDGTEGHADGKIFALPNSSRCPLQTIKAYL